jgi:hypothetical protein
MIDSHAIRLPSRRHSCRRCGPGIAQIPWQPPEFLAEYAGDTLWALMLYLLVGTLLAGRPVLTRAAISLALAFLVEVSQLYHAPWID